MGVKYSVNENFFEAWSPEMAYILGYIYADGSLEDATYIRGKYLRISSTDKSSINTIKKLLNSSHKVVIIPKSGNDKTQYLLRIGSHKIFNDLTQLGVYPKKSLTITFPHIPKKYLRDFVRGYFDGDGCVHLEKRNEAIKCIRTIFTCGSKKYLVQLSNILESEAGLTSRKVYTSQRSYQLRFSTEDSKKLFLFMYRDNITSPLLNRKYKTFMKYFHYKKKREMEKRSKI